MSRTLLHRAGPLAVTVPAAALAVAGTLTAAGCAQPGQRALALTPAQTATIVGDSANGKTVHVVASERVRLILSSTYWNVTGSSVPHVLRQDGATRTLTRPGGCPKIPGLGCTPEETDFTALGHGKAVITAHRASCGEALRCPPARQSFSVTVIVTDQSA